MNLTKTYPSISLSIQSVWPKRAKKKKRNQKKKARDKENVESEQRQQEEEEAAENVLDEVVFPLSDKAQNQQQKGITNFLTVVPALHEEEEVVIEEQQQGELEEDPRDDVESLPSHGEEEIMLEDNRQGKERGEESGEEPRDDDSVEDVVFVVDDEEDDPQDIESQVDAEEYEEQAEEQEETREKLGEIRMSTPSPHSPSARCIVASSDEKPIEEAIGEAVEEKESKEETAEAEEEQAAQVEKAEAAKEETDTQGSETEEEIIVSKIKPSYKSLIIQDPEKSEDIELDESAATIPYTPNISSSNNDFLGQTPSISSSDSPSFYEVARRSDDLIALAVTSGDLILSPSPTSSTFSKPVPNPENNIHDEEEKQNIKKVEAPADEEEALKAGKEGTEDEEKQPTVVSNGYSILYTIFLVCLIVLSIVSIAFTCHFFNPLLNNGRPEAIVFPGYLSVCVIALLSVIITSDW